MRKAMAGAEVGDDVHGDDPTVNSLEALCAEMLGKEAALFVPSGTFGNQLALFTWCRRGTEVILGESCHIVAYEAGASSIIAGVQLRCIPDTNGVLKLEDIQQRLRKQDLHAPATSLICVENAYSSGKVVALEKMDAVRAVADKWSLPIHLDGARIFNAAAALNCSAAQVASRADSVMVCLSKGLCAPVGSLLAGTKDFITEARLKRKIMGGGLRQAGVLAAAGIIALKEHSPLLIADNDRAKRLAMGLASINGISVNTHAVDINMVFFSLNGGVSDELAKKIVNRFAERDIVINPPEEGTFRFVTHYWINDKNIEEILFAAKEIFSGLPGGGLPLESI
jgi:threonine aldolase